MLRLIGAAAVLALATANPTLAQGKGNDGGDDKARDGDHAGVDHGPGKRDQDRGKDRSERGDAGKSAARAVERTIERANAGRDDDRVERIRNVRGDDRVRMIERTVVRDFGRNDDGRRHSGWDGDGDWNGRGQIFASVPGCPPGLAKKNNGCLPPGLTKQARDRTFGYQYRPTLFGIPLRTRTDYVYYDGYLVPASGSGLSYIPLLGGALGVGRVWPQAYPSLQLTDWQRDYYGFEDARDYRYADNVVYDIDPATSAIEAVVALLTGNEFTVGGQMPLGYDVYNVPMAYQDEYYDTDEALYRYADGRVYEIDPTTMLIEKAIDLIL